MDWIVKQKGSEIIVSEPFSHSAFDSSFSRDKESYYSAQDSYPQDNADSQREKNSQNKRQFEDQKKERDQNYAQYYGKATGGKIFCLQHRAVLPAFITSWYERSFRFAG